MSRDLVLGSIRAALGWRQVEAQEAGTVAPVEPAVSDLVTREAQVLRTPLPDLPAPQTFANPVELFIDRARQVGVRVETAASIQEAAALAARWCAQREARRAAVWSTPDLAPVVERLRSEGLEILPPGTPPDIMAQADVGVTGAEWGIAETGTLVLPCDPERPRLVSLLPPAHLAVLSAGRILPDLPALFTRLGPLPSATAFITGPGRSADIGLVPTVGAHGPFEVAILLVTCWRPDPGKA